jgi:radical SAM superfamily enzyme YgiQ (UPF0313 family)
VSSFALLGKPGKPAVAPKPGFETASSNWKGAPFPPRVGVLRSTKPVFAGPAYSVVVPARKVSVVNTRGLAVIAGRTQPVLVSGTQSPLVTLAPLVTLVRPAKVCSRFVLSSPFAPPLGIAYLAAMLREARIDVQCVDAAAAPGRFRQGPYIFEGLTNDELCDSIDPRTQLIGVSVMFTQDWPYVRTLIQLIRERFPEALIVAGGEHITAVPEYSLRDCPALDICVLGEGDEAIVDLARRAGESREAVLEAIGIAYLDGDRFVRTPPRPRLRQVDKLPIPAWDLFPIETYLDSNNSFGVQRGRSLSILATRGCPYQCTFCSNPNMYGKSYFARSPGHVLDEIEYLMRAYGVQNVDFYDLTMVLRRDWVLEFCREIERRGLKFTWQMPGGTRSEIIDDEVAAAMYRNGCRNFAYAPESGSPRILKLIKKRVDLKRLTSSVRAALRRGLHVKCNIIIGFPDERRSDIVKTWLFCCRMALLGIDAVEPMLFIPYPGTQLFNQLRAEGRIGDFDDEYFRSLTAMQDPMLPTHYCRHVRGAELLFWRLFTMFSFFAISFTLRPWRLARLVWSVFRNGSETVVEHRLSALLRRPSAVVTDTMITSTPS